MTRQAQVPFKTAKSSKGRTYTHTTPSITYDRIRGHIDKLFAQDKQLSEIMEDVARLGAHLLMQGTLEAEITSSLAATAVSGPWPAKTLMQAPTTGTGT